MSEREDDLERDRDRRLDYASKADNLAPSPTATLGGVAVVLGVLTLFVGLFAAFASSQADVGVGEHWPMTLIALGIAAAGLVVCCVGLRLINRR